jgi:GT2 family glycosyltransferase
LYNAIEEIEIEYSNETLVSPIGANIFSCFTIPDSVVNRIGYFDESISPGYGYYEDTDFARRLYLSNISIKEINKPLVQHAGSSTLKIFTPTEMNEHHRKFKVARSNYEHKWGGDMGKETVTEVRRIESLNNMVIVDRWDNDSILEK